MARTINVNEYGKKEPLRITIGEAEYDVPVPTIAKLKAAAKIEQSAGDGPFDKIEAAIKTLVILTDIPAEEFDALTMEELDRLSNDISSAREAEEEKNDESTAPES